MTDSAIEALRRCLRDVKQERDTAIRRACDAEARARSLERDLSMAKKTAGEAVGRLTREKDMWEADCGDRNAVLVDLHKLLNAERPKCQHHPTVDAVAVIADEEILGAEAVCSDCFAGHEGWSVPLLQQRLAAVGMRRRRWQARCNTACDLISEMLCAIVGDALRAHLLPPKGWRGSFDEELLAIEEMRSRRERSKKRTNAAG